MGGWVGREYLLLSDIPNSSLPVHFDPSIFDLKLIGFLQVKVNGGEMPHGIGRLTRL